MTQPESDVCKTFTDNKLHATCAITFFVCIAYVSLFRAKDTLRFVQDDSNRLLYKIVYLIIGFLTIAIPGIALALSSVEHSSQSLFWLELSGVLVFGCFWIVKSIELYNTQAELIIVKAK